MSPVISMTRAIEEGSIANADRLVEASKELLDLGDPPPSPALVIYTAYVVALGTVDELERRLARLPEGIQMLVDLAASEVEGTRKESVT